jgi:hypothetical protein
MSAVTRLFNRPDVGQKMAEVKAETPAATPARSAASEAREEMAARRRARRGGRALLSEARLTPEQGVGQTTLGAGQM